ncbi:MAG: hypothetical protein ACK44Q_04570, partial [Pirellulaceae bacterium]
LRTSTMSPTARRAFAARIAVSYSMKLFVRASGDETDLGPVRPHIEVAPVAGRDAALERAIEEIRKMQAERKQ